MRKNIAGFPDDSNSTDLNLQHNYCLDVDILGERSLFNKLNYTQTYLGSDRLKLFLLSRLTDSEKIKNRKIAIQEFSAKLNWSIDFLTMTKTFNVNRQLIITNIHHPLISSNQIISNDFSTINKNNIAIITGANMTGKSTFLRTIGVNLVLAMNGCPVAADQFLFYPMSLFTSMRTNDSLSDDTSYFNAEIKKLKTLVESLEKKIPQYIILDEILKGTNSHDKLMGFNYF